MHTPISTKKNIRTFNAILSLPITIGLILLLWLAYTSQVALDKIGYIRQPVVAILEAITALVGLGIMLGAGFTVDELFLRLRPLSKKGFLALLITTPLFLPVFLTGAWGGLNWMGLLVYAPGTAISQELFFRCSVFPLVLRLLPGRSGLAIFLATLLHGLWHVGPLALGQPWFVVLSVIGVPFFSGLAWNWQVKHDRTFIWVMLYHILFDQAISLFIWGNP